MTLLHDIAAALGAGAGYRPSLPEYRQIELYTKRKNLAFAAPEPAEAGVPAGLAGACRAFLLLDAVLAAISPVAASGAGGWERYRELPRGTLVDRILAEVWRVLRVARSVAFHPGGEGVERDGVVRLKAIDGGTVLILDITPAGLGLLDSAVAWYLGALGGPYPLPYLEAMLARYFADVVDEIRRYSDEGRSLYQFNRPVVLNRHFRFDCDNPRTRSDDGALVFEIGAAHANPALYPIDFYVLHGDALHIVPVEALAQGRIALTELPRWRARIADGATLPASFRGRFSHETAAVNQPMT